MARRRWELRPLGADGKAMFGSEVIVDSPEAFAQAVLFFCSEGAHGFEFLRLEGS